ncbi:MAG: DNA-directed RNA polymerase subunit N [archaeon]
MITPIRCFSCGKTVAGHFASFKERVHKGEAADDVFKNMGISRYCCRRMLLAHVELIDDVMRYNT